MPFLKIPHIRQKAEADCLVACAAMMLAAVNLTIDYGRIRTVLGFEGDGLPYSRLHRLNRIQDDVHVAIQPGTLQHLMTAIDAGTPPAVFVDTGELPYWTVSVYHAVVLTGYTDTDFYLNDPAFPDAPQVVSMGDLDLAWLEHDTYYAVIQRRVSQT
jgi:ABC-type bacteriocin/lantibiotic exporter with double-glycine peptidase domain